VVSVVTDNNLKLDFLQASVPNLNTWETDLQKLNWEHTHGVD